MTTQIIKRIAKASRSRLIIFGLPLSMLAIAVACGDDDATAPPAGLDDAGFDAHDARPDSAPNRDAVSDGASDSDRHDGLGFDALLDGVEVSDAAPADSDAGNPDTRTDTGADVPVSDVDAGKCPSAIGTADGGGCGSVIANWPTEGNEHVDFGSAVRYCTRPPSSGAHYPSWAAYRSYTKPIAPGYLVHDLEHGAVVIWYQCSGSCPAIAASLQAIVDARPVDPLCDPDAGVKRRIIIVPDPTLDVPIAAAAWQWTYRASCVDATSLRTFIDAHYAKAAEDTCADGLDPTSLDAGP